ncbi:MAG: endo-1,4-beta-xylanase [Bacteroidales bacterium]|nr:endo-1,4-beta-xylanase [Bacteroidales bacterium]MBN2763445.1 endo-1,4-beta-xylanase [Bacteroidales bacterium]
MKKSNLNHSLRSFAGFCLVMVFLCLSCRKPADERGLKDAFSDKFLIGVSVDTYQILKPDSLAQDFIKMHFNAVTAENAMKWERIHPLPGQYTFMLADSIVDFAVRNGMAVIGHTLVWHAQTPSWVFEDSTGNLLTRDSLLAVLKDHVLTVVGRYKGRIKGWDVVNEALNEDGSMRKSKWMEIIGEDYVEKAFEYAHEADPDAELYYNDYNIELPGKREGAIKLIKDLQAKGIKVGGLGIQGHWHMDFPSLGTIDTSLNDFGELGLQVMITEFEVNVLPERELSIVGAEISQTAEYMASVDPYADGLPDSVQQQLADRYAGIFNLFVKHNDKVSRVTFWGIHDGYSWKNNWPIRGRTNHPLLFDRQYQPKPAYYSVINTTQE